MGAWQRAFCEGFKRIDDLLPCYSKVAYFTITPRVNQRGGPVDLQDEDFVNVFAQQIERICL
jgi:hypothetical protein